MFACVLYAIFNSLMCGSKYTHALANSQTSIFCIWNYYRCFHLILFPQHHLFALAIHFLTYHKIFHSIFYAFVRHTNKKTTRQIFADALMSWHISSKLCANVDFESLIQIANQQLFMLLPEFRLGKRFIKLLSFRRNSFDCYDMTLKIWHLKRH